MRIHGLGMMVGAVLATGAFAQAPANKPLSVIDWLDEQSATQAALPRLTEPDVTDSGTVPSVSVDLLDTAAPRRVGLAPPNITGLPDTIWASSKGRALARDIKSMPRLHLPALQSLYYTLLLAEAAPPTTGADIFDMARVDALMDLGALDPALALIEQSGPSQSPTHFARYFDMALLAGTDASACAILRDKPHLSPSKSHDIYCTARAGEWDTAVLLLGTGRVLGLVPDDMAKALERFLDPDLFEGEPALATPKTPDPLSFRLYQAIGTPIPARVWPLVYANADLADTAGWKAQVEAGRTSGTKWRRARQSAPGLVHLSPARCFGRRLGSNRSPAAVRNRTAHRQFSRCLQDAARRMARDACSPLDGTFCQPVL